MNEDIEFHQNRIRMLAGQLADSLEYLTQTERRNDEAHQVMLRSTKLMTEVGVNFKKDSANALAALQRAVEQSPMQLAHAVEKLAATTAKESVEQVTAGLVSANRDAIKASEKLKNNIAAQAETISRYAFGGGLVGALVGGGIVALVSYFLR